MSINPDSFSVLICTQNRYKIISQTILPFLQCPFVSEILIIDDHSTHDDDMSNFISSIEDNPLVRLLYNPGDAGLSSARNHGINNISTNYFLICDDDDLYDCSNLTNIFKKISQCSSKSPIYCLVPFFASAVLGKPFAKSRHFKLSYLFNLGLTPPVSSQIYSKYYLDSKGIRYDNLVKSGVDHDFWISLLPHNPRVTLLRNKGPHVAFINSPTRMTQDLRSRKEKISQSIRIWEQKLPSLAHSKLSKCYDEYLLECIIIKSLKDRSYSINLFLKSWRILLFVLLPRYILFSRALTFYRIKFLQK